MSNWFKKLFGAKENAKEANHEVKDPMQEVKESVDEIKREFAPAEFEQSNSEAKTETPEVSSVLETQTEMPEHPESAPAEHSSTPEFQVEENDNEEKTE